MITVKTNINQAVQVTITKLQNLRDTDRMLRTCATSVLDLMKKRIHRDGIASDGSQIGTYSPAYMKVRTGNFQNSDRISRGKNKGNLKNAGVFTKKGTTIFTQADEETVTSKRGFVKIGFLKKVRPNYNRGNDTKVIASLTRQMENDEQVIATNTGYAIGFNNRENFLKSQYVESTYKKEIFALAEPERQAITDIVKTFVTDAVS